MNSEYRAKRLALYKKEGITLDKDDKIVDFTKVMLDPIA